MAKKTPALWNVDSRIERLEGIIPSACTQRGTTSAPGTAITRVSMDTSLAEEYGIELTEEDEDPHLPHNYHLSRFKESIMVWCLSVGVMRMPKAFYYGRTIRECVEKAEKDLLKEKQ